MITPPSYIMPSDRYGIQTQQLQQLHQSNMNASSAAAISHQALPQLSEPISQNQAHFPPIAQRSFSASGSNHNLSNYSYSNSQNAISQGPAITASSSAYMQPQQQQQHYSQQQQPQSKRLPSLTQASGNSSYSLPDITAPQYGTNNYQLPYPMKGLQPNASYTQPQIGSYSVNGTTFYVPSVPVDHGDYVSRSQQQQQQQMKQQATAQSQNQQYNYNNNDSAVTGGVSAKLDYNLEEMSEFIATKALDIMSRCPGSPKPELAAQSFVDSFTKFTFQVLTATRLPKSTLILALVYLSDRWSKGNIPKTSSVIHDVYKMLVVALLLANKFHDDNTFTNKSWHEATGVPVIDLGIIECDWLRAIQWTLHLEKSQGWDEWNQVYEYWIANHRKSTMAPAASYRSPYPSMSRNSYPLSPLPSPESTCISPEKARHLYSSPPPLSYMSYNKWYSNNVASTGSASSLMSGSTNVAPLNNTVAATISNTLSRSSSMSTIATPPSSHGDSYAPYFHQQQPSIGSMYDGGMYHQRQQHHIPSSHYVSSYGGTGCTCPDCSFDSISKIPTWGYGYAAAY